MAFADDEVLLSTSRIGLQFILDHYLEGTAFIGLTPGMSRCASFGIPLRLSPEEVCVGRGALP